MVNIRDLFAETGLSDKQTDRRTDRQTNKQNHRTTNPIDPPLPKGSKYAKSIGGSCVRFYSSMLTPSCIQKRPKAATKTQERTRIDYAAEESQRERKSIADTAGVKFNGRVSLLQGI